VITEGSDPKALHNFVSVALDGQIMFWDTVVKPNPRKLDIPWASVYSMPLARVVGTGDYCTLQLLLAPAGEPLGFLCTTEVRLTGQREGAPQRRD
jgi:hypothetical protein